MSAKKRKSVEKGRSQQERLEKALRKVDDVALHVLAECPFMNLSGRHEVGFPCLSLKARKIDAIRPRSTRKHHKVVKTMPMGEKQVAVLFQIRGKPTDHHAIFPVIGKRFGI